MRRKSLWGPTGWLCSFFILSLCFSSVGLCDMIPDEGTDNEELFNRGGAYAFDTFQRYDRVFVYTLFRSGDGPTPVDGDSGSGVFCSPGAGGVATGPSSVVFMDSCGAGSALRGVSTRGLFTIAGSLTERGFVNGAPSQTLFGGLSSGGPINGIALVGDRYYLADTTNNAIRVIDKTVGTSSTYVNKGLKNPSFVAPYNMPLGGANLFVSDTGNNRVLFVPTGIASPPLSVALSGFYPGTLAVSNTLSTLFYVRSSSTIAAASLSDLDNTWVVGNASCTGYVNSLLLTGTNDAELMYYGQGTDGENQVFSLPTSTNYGECPNVMFQWPYTDPNRTVRLMVTRDATSWFVITSTSVYVASLKSLPYLDSSLEDSSDFATRQPMAASFPRAAFPTDNSTLMSELYSWMMKDISIALGTTRYGVEMQMNRTFYDTHGSIANNVLVISPEMEKNWWNSDMIDRIEHNTDYLSVLIPGSFNVSTWGDGITGFTSKDGSIEILPLLGPLGMSTSEGQKRLKDSPWYWTRRFLDGLRNNDDDSTYSDLGPFCTYTCGLHCYNEEAHRQMCAGYPGCDDVCKGAIGASTVLGTSFVALGVLGVLNPLNLLNAFTMVPVF